MDKDLKSSIWKNLFKLIIPHRSKFFGVVFLSLMATAANLLQPLVYREAINDIAGLFVQQAKDDAHNEIMLEDSLDDERPITSFIEKEFSQVDSDSVQQSPDTVVKAVAPVVHSKSHHNSKANSKKITDKPKPVKQAHTHTTVAPRTPEQAIKTLLWAVVILFFIDVFGYIFWLIGENLNLRLICSVEQSFILRTFSHVLKLPLSFFSKRSSAAIAKQIDQGEEVTSVVNHFSQTILPEFLSLIGILIIMLTQNLTLTLISLAVIPIYLFVSLRSLKGMDDDLSKYYERWEQISTRIQDALTGIKTVKLSGAENREVNKMQNIASVAYIDYIKRNKTVNIYTFWGYVLTSISTAFVLAYGGYLTLNNRLTPGDVVMFVSYLDRLYGPIDSLTELWLELQRNLVSLSRAFRLTANETEEQLNKDLEIKKGDVEFKNVSFSYNSEREILKGLSFRIKHGTVTAIVGTSGAGKTTTVDLLMKLFKPTSGEIFIDGQNIWQCDSSSVRRQLGMVSVDGAIFGGTLADNIRYKRPDANDADVYKAAIGAGLEHTLQRLPEGLKTLVGENGFGLSVGERQRIQIARVLISEPRILILDEATANLDYNTEAEIKLTIEKISKENTVIIIAHRYSMVKDADHVIVLTDGKILEEGSPFELIKNKGWFFNFANSIEEEIEDDETETEDEETEDEETDEDEK